MEMSACRRRLEKAGENRLMEIWTNGKRKSADMMYELIFILNNIESFKWSDALFLPENEVWDKHTKGLIQDPDDIENDEDELPKAAIENHFIYTLSIQSIQLIVENAKRQKQNISTDDLLEAFLFYYDNDAYMDFSDKNTNV